jgi:SAM-dependent methyltransferase
MEQLTNKIKRKCVAIFRIGLLSYCRIFLDRIWFRIIAWYFKFDPWHSSAPFSSRPYKKTVVNLANDLSPDSVVEIGSGLGELLFRIKARKRYGYDIDLGVIRAARFLYSKDISFYHGDATQVHQDNIDLLLMINWIHNLSPQKLEEILLSLAPRVKYMLLDAIDDDGPDSYRYKHDFNFLKGVAERLSITRAPDEPRSFHLFRVIV